MFGFCKSSGRHYVINDFIVTSRVRVGVFAYLGASVAHDQPPWLLIACNSSDTSKPSKTHNAQGPMKFSGLL